MKRQARDRVRVFAKHMSSEEWYPNTEILKTQQLKKKNEQPNSKMGKKSEQTPHQRRHRGDKQANEKIFNIIYHQRITN